MHTTPTTAVWWWSRRRARQTSEELLAQCDASAEISDEDRQWLDSKPDGGELG